MEAGEFGRVFGVRRGCPRGQSWSGSAMACETGRPTARESEPHTPLEQVHAHAGRRHLGGENRRHSDLPAGVEDASDCLQSSDVIRLAILRGPRPPRRRRVTEQPVASLRMGD